MKNILVLKHYKLQNASGWDPEIEHRWTPQNYTDQIKKIEQYDEMKKMCVQSAKKFLLGLDDIIIHESEVYDIQHAFKQHFFDLYDIWKQGDVNILYADLDVLFIREFNWFNFSNQFVMYDITNSGIRYHGHDMDPKLWEFAFEQCKFWDTKKWDYEQDIYINMALHPLNWMHKNNTISQFSRRVTEYRSLVINEPQEDCPEALYNNNKTCCAVHFHSSQGFSQIKRMEDMFQFLKI